MTTLFLYLSIAVLVAAVYSRGTANAITQGAISVEGDGDPRLLHLSIFTAVLGKAAIWPLTVSIDLYIFYQTARNPTPPIVIHSPEPPEPPPPPAPEPPIVPLASPEKLSEHYGLLFKALVDAAEPLDDGEILPSTVVAFHFSLAVSECYVLYRSLGCSSMDAQGAIMQCAANSMREKLPSIHDREAEVIAVEKFARWSSS